MQLKPRNAIARKCSSLG